MNQMRYQLKGSLIPRSWGSAASHIMALNFSFPFYIKASLSYYIKKQPFPLPLLHQIFPFSHSVFFHQSFSFFLHQIFPFLPALFKTFFVEFDSNFRRMKLMWQIGTLFMALGLV